ncbi:methionyl-tRNA formyltransferase [Mycoplasmopsis mustelae]|uniref:Methionyl-tRNA formyltransferase n=1 Tax=Mycoplasmopsis mustelae TaxID=171289 RepID=A0A4R7UC27_9BACT|nr:methionyl-tRNA formyltransferase [Mycoplasmopsis mustelae]TDV23276.1 methionyl-tRNA formyltransferase [Mycoplasmopsis mustelae]
MKIILAGTPEFAIKPFEAIIKNFNVVAIVSQPDRPAKRGYKLQPTATKLLAQKYQIPLYQPEKIGDIYQELQNLNADILLTCAFGQYIPMKVLKLPKIASINIHGSLLPKYRGAAPIQHSLLNNDSVTGLSLIYMTKEFDAGDILFEAEIDINQRDTSDSLFKKLSQLAAENIVEWLNKISKNEIQPKKQDTKLVVLSPKLDKADALLTFQLTKQEAFNKIRAFSSNPGAYIMYQNRRLKVFYAYYEPIKNAIELKFSDGSLYASDYQFESKKRVILK